MRCRECTFMQGSSGPTECRSRACATNDQESFLEFHGDRSSYYSSAEKGTNAIVCLTGMRLLIVMDAHARILTVEIQPIPPTLRKETLANEPPPQIQYHTIPGTGHHTVLYLAPTPAGASCERCRSSHARSRPWAAGVGTEERHKLHGRGFPSHQISKNPRPKPRSWAGIGGLDTRTQYVVIW